MYSIAQGKKMSKKELVDLCMEEARRHPITVSKSGKTCPPTEGYRRNLERKTKEELVIEYNSLCEMP